MAEWGGKRTPNNPAPVSGPGSLSERTDGFPQQGAQPVRDVGGFEYGGRQEFRDMQGAAPMSESGIEAASVPMFAPTDRPDEPVTAGAARGAGEGPLPAPRRDLASLVEKLAWTDESGQLMRLSQVLRSKGL